MNASEMHEERAMNRTTRPVGPAVALGIALCALLSGCATDQDALVRFLATADAPGRGGEYHVMPPDVLTIQASPTEEYANRTVKVGPDGKAFLPLVGAFELAGKTTTEIAGELTENLRDYYEDVQVTVTISQYASQKYYVMGEVSRPGVYPYTGNDSLLAAIAGAGPTRLAWPERVYLVRGLDPLPGESGLEVNADGRVGGKLQKIRINIMEMARDGDLSANVTLAQNDVIFVPANPFAKVGLAIQNLLLPATPAVQAAGFPYDFSENARNVPDTN